MLILAVCTFLSATAVTEVEVIFHAFYVAHGDVTESNRLKKKKVEVIVVVEWTYKESVEIHSTLDI